MKGSTCERCGKQIEQDKYRTNYAVCDDCLTGESWMRTVGSWLAGIVVSAVIVGICVLGHRTGICRCRYEASANTTNTTHGTVRSSVLPFMANPVHNWHPANINHVYHR